MIKKEVLRLQLGGLISSMCDGRSDAAIETQDLIMGHFVKDNTIVIDLDLINLRRIISNIAKVGDCILRHKYE